MSQIAPFCILQVILDPRLLYARILLYGCFHTFTQGHVPIAYDANNENEIGAMHQSRDTS